MKIKQKKGKKEKEKSLVAAKSGLVGMEGYFKTYNRVKNFFAELKPFLIETAFYAKLLELLLGFETKVTQLIASKCGTNMQLINFKQLSLSCI